MVFSVRSCLITCVAVVAASAVVMVSSVRPPAPDLVASPAFRLSAAVQPLTTQSDNIPSLADEIGMGIIPSLRAPFPTPPTIGPSPAPTDFNSLIKNTYLAIEPWVQYGFELVTWGVGWIPWVGWLAPQIMIFYFFGERIAHSDVWNLDDWLWGSLPFVQGWINNFNDKWNALVQLGIDEWNFWLPNFPLPPFPFAAQQTTLAANLTTAQRQPGQTSASSPQPPLVTPPTPGSTLAAKLAGPRTTAAPTSAATSTTATSTTDTSTTVVTTKASNLPVATVTDSPKAQITKPATGLSDALTRDSLKLTTAPATGQGGPSHHAADKTSTVATGTANGGKPLPATHTEPKKK